MHDIALLITLAGGLAFALVFGWITERLGLSTLVGYMVAGIVVGPHTPGFVADARIASQLAEIGVVLLMFSVGQHFHPQELLRVWRIAVPGAVGQSLVAALAGWALARAFGWSHAAGIVFGMALAVASTVVLMRMLLERDRLASHDGHVAVGWLIVEDLFTVAALVVLPVFAAGGANAGNLSLALLEALAKVLVFALVIGFIGTRIVSQLLERMVRARSTELFTLTVFVVAIGVAVLASELFQVSVALGAFFAGLVVGQSRFGAQAAADMAPFRDVFSALFFVSIGVLFNPGVLVEQTWLVLGVLAIVLLVKPLVALLVVRVLRESARTAATVSIGLAQIGEFSFILASLGTAIGVLPREALDVLVVAAIVSIAANPLLFRFAERWFRAAQPAEEGAAPATVVPHVLPGGAHSAPVVLAGHRALGRRLVARAAESGLRLTVIDASATPAEQMDSPHIAYVYGNATRPEVLLASGVREARVLVVADLSLAEKMQVCTAARRLNPRLAVIGAAGNDAERAWLTEFGASFVSNALDDQSEQIGRAIRSHL